MSEGEGPQSAPNKVSAEDKLRMARLAESCREAETDELVQGEALRAVTRWANARRAEIGMPPFEDDDDDDLDNPPELGLYRRARALGMVRSSR